MQYILNIKIVDLSKVMKKKIQIKNFLKLRLSKKKFHFGFSL
jgi:hypothetical protein